MAFSKHTLHRQSRPETGSSAGSSWHQHSGSPAPQVNGAWQAAQRFSGIYVWVPAFAGTTSSAARRRTARRRKTSCLRMLRQPRQ
jgi:hypothetical protein